MSEAGGALPVVAVLEAVPERADEALRILTDSAPVFLTEEGCEQYQLLADLDDPARFVILERWRGPEALQAHFDSAAFKAMAGKLEGLLAAPPRVLRLRAL